jgi:hypothetical protein
MANVYAQAACTSFSCGSSDSHGGCFHKRNTFYASEQQPNGIKYKNLHSIREMEQSAMPPTIGNVKLWKNHGLSPASLITETWLENLRGWRGEVVCAN